MDEQKPRRGHFRNSRWERLGHGVYRPAGAGSGDPYDELQAWALVLPPSGCFTHVTAARAYRWQLPWIPSSAPLFVAMHDQEARPRRKELRVSRHPRPPARLVHREVSLARPAEVLLACARDLSLLDLVVLIDSALHLGHCRTTDLDRVCTGRRRGAPALRRALAYADGRAESAWESVLRMFHVACEVPVEPQHEVRTPDGRFVARGDLWLRGTTVLHEYDGGVHRDRAQHRRDLARDRALVAAGWTRRGYTSADLLGRSVVMLREADAALGRAHDPRRLDPWRALLRESSLSPAGQQRLKRRWGLDS
jgi:very-short-patch-repair endonuclease